MNELDPRIVASLDRLVPAVSTGRDWPDVARRAARPRLGRGRVVFALAGAAVLLVVVATPVGAALRDGIGDFSSWVKGSPGTKAPESEQQAFDTVNEHSWAAFPRGTELRELIRTTAGGRTYILYGFRSGETLCLKLEGTTPREQTTPACAPLSTLAHTSAPALAIDGNHSFFDQASNETALVSFGIAADGVKRVDVHAVNETGSAQLGGNAYLWVEPDPNTGEYVKSMSVTGANGATTALPMVLFRSGSVAVGTPRGPSDVEAPIDNPTVGWVVNHEERGASVAETRLTPEERRQLTARYPDARLFKPDPLSNLVVGIQSSGPEQWCIVDTGGGSSCGDQAHFFDRGPFNYVLSGGGANASDQFMTIAGLAADGVARMQVFFPDGGRQAVPISDNVFDATIPARFPIRIVGYDAQGRIAGLDTFPPNGMGGMFARPAPSAPSFRDVLQVHGPNGTTATVSTGPVTPDRRRCWRVAYSSGEPESGCDIDFYTGPKITVNGVQQAGRDLFVVGGVDGRITDHVELHFDDGDAVNADPVDDRFLFAIPKAHLSGERQFAYVVAIGPGGHPIQRQRIAFRTAS